MEEKTLSQAGVDIYSKEVLDRIKIPAPIRTSPDAFYYRNYRYFAMQASMEITRGGRLWSCWICGADGPNAYLIATYSDDFGSTWQDICLVIDPHDDALPMNMNTHIGCLWQDPLGRLWLFYQQSFGMWDGEGANYAIVCEDPDAEQPIWGAPRYISIGASLKKPIVLRNGEWLLPVSVWERSHISYALRDAHRELDAMRGAHVFVSADQGGHWSYRGGLSFTNHRFNEHSLAEVEEGKIALYSRCTDAIRRSYSQDGGRTWSAEEVAFLHVDSLAMVRMLPSGNLLLIKHGQTMQEPTRKRSHLSAFVSTDQGQSWCGGLLLDERVHVSYPDIAIAANGEIFVQYDHSRSGYAEILFARFTEEDVLQGGFYSPHACTKQTIKDWSGIKGHSRVSACEKQMQGSGTQMDPFRITDVATWRSFAAEVEQGRSFEGAYVVLTADLDFQGEDISPVGYSLPGGHVVAFSGDFDGRGHTLSNFSQNARDLHTRGVFGNVSGGSVHSLTIANAQIRGCTDTAAVVGLVSQNERYTTIYDCTVLSDVKVVGYGVVGGIVGRAEGSVHLSSCQNEGEIYVPYTLGDETQICAAGIVGKAENDLRLRNCRNTGTVCVRYAQACALGGMVGEAERVSLDDCENTGRIETIGCTERVWSGELCGSLSE